MERLSGQRLRDFMRERIFEPLGMRRTALGLGPGVRMADCVQMAQQAAASAAAAGSGDSPAAPGGFGNTAYWRDMGHPWGGLHASARDVATLLQVALHLLTQHTARHIKRVVRE